MWNRRRLIFTFFFPRENRISSAGLRQRSFALLFRKTRISLCLHLFWRGNLFLPETYCHLRYESDCLQTLFCCFQLLERVGFSCGTPIICVEVTPGSIHKPVWRVAERIDGAGRRHFEWRLVHFTPMSLFKSKFSTKFCCGFFEVRAMFLPPYLTLLLFFQQISTSNIPPLPNENLRHPSSCFSFWFAVDFSLR